MEDWNIRVRLPEPKKKKNRNVSNVSQIFLFFFEIESENEHSASGFTKNKKFPEVLLSKCHSGFFLVKVLNFLF